MEDDMADSVDLSVRGRRVKAPAAMICGVTVVSQGRLVKIGEVFDEYWLERSALPAYEAVVAQLKARDDRPDLFTFAQRVPETDPVHGYFYEMDNVAVLPLATYERWLQKQIPAAAKRNIRASEKRGVSIRVCEYDDAYVRGISAIYNETPVRAGRKFWHYGKDLEAVRIENGTYAARSTYLAALCRGEMIGYLKIVWDSRTAAIMQILSKISFRDYRPNNALMAEAVKQSCLRGVEYLLYEKFDYGRKTGDSLTRFKQNNGFMRMDVPRYYIPLTARGALALRIGLHTDPKERFPEWLAMPFRNLRQKWRGRDVSPH